MLWWAHSSIATEADSARWTDRTAAVFRLVASQAGGDGEMPYTGAPGALAQDASGFIWIGTDVGLERWDGYHIRTYVARAGDSCALPADYVVTLYADRARLWVSTFGGGLAYYDPRTDCFHAVGSNTKDLAQAPVTGMASDGVGGLWLGTTAGLLHLEADLAHVIRLSEDASADAHLSRDRIGCLLLDRHGILWVGSAHGLERRALTDVGFTSVALPAGAKVGALLEGSDGRIWVGTSSDGAYVFDPSTDRIQAIDGIRRIQPMPLIWRAAQSPNGEIWFGTTSAGIIRVNPKTLGVRELRHQKGVATSLPDDEIDALLPDRRGLLWAASETGFGFFNPRNDVSTILSGDELNQVGEGLVKAVVRMADGRIAINAGTQLALIGALGTGAELVKFDPLPRLPTVATLTTVDGSSLFVAGLPYGLVWIDRAERRAHPVSLPGPEGQRHVLALLPDRERLWVGATEGIWVLEHAADGQVAALPWRVSRWIDLRDVRVLAMGSGDTPWVGTLKGLYRLDSTSYQPSHVQLVGLTGDPIPDPYVTSLHRETRGRLWIGTNSDGLFVVDASDVSGGRARVLRRLSAELPSGTVTEILEDAQGTVWVSTDRGIARIDPTSLTVRRLTRGDDIAIASYKGGGCADDSCHELMFGGLNGITLIRPHAESQASEPPAVVITRISVGRTEVSSAPFDSNSGPPVLRVPPNGNNLAVEFAALDYSDPMHNLYEYKLEGNDTGWTPTRFDTRTAMYTNLAPGDYRLRLRGTNHSGDWSPQERQLLIRVAAAWYQTIWFRALEVLAVVAALAMLVQARTRFLRARQRELEALVDERTQALARATKERAELVENLAHDLRTPLTSLRGYLEALSLKSVVLSEPELSRYIGVALRQGERLNRLVRELFDLVRLDDLRMRLTLERFNLAELVQDVVQEFSSIAQGRTIAFLPDPGTESVHIVGDLGLIQRMIDNLIDNALHHTPEGGATTVKLKINADHGVLEVRDNGQGIERADLDRIFKRYERADTVRHAGGAGLGLAIVKRIVELHSGSIEVESAIGVGTAFTVRLPFAGPTAGEGRATGS